MSAVRIVVIGDDDKDPLVKAAQALLDRLGRARQTSIQFLKPKRKGRAPEDKAVIAEEGAALLKASEGAVRVALDAGGTLFDSRGFQSKLDKLRARGKDVCFLIGGPAGLDPRVRDEADAVWSLSKMTYAHKLALLVLCEQLYRAQELERGGPYAR